MTAPQNQMPRRRFLRLLGGTALSSLVLSGCAGQNEAGSAASATQDHITLLMPGASDQTACARVSQRLSALMRPALGFGIEIEQVADDDYSSALWARMQGGTMPDIFFLAEYQSLSTYIYEDGIFPLTTLLSSHPDLYARFDETMWDYKKYFRIIYSIPSGTIRHHQLCFVARSDWMGQLGVDAAQISTMEDLGTLLREVQRGWTNAVPVVSHRGQTMLFDGLDPLNDQLGVLTADTGTTVQNWYATEHYASLCDTMRQWYREGLILNGACLRTESALDLMRGCNGFGFFYHLNSDSLARLTRIYGESLTAIPLGDCVQSSTALSEGWCLPTQTSQKDRALDFFAFLYSDTEALATFVLGQADGEEDSDHPWQNTCMSMAGFAEQAADEEVVVSPADGFLYESSSQISHVDACLSLEKQYHRALMCGYLDPYSALPRFRQELEEAGIQEILSSKQSRLNSWLAVRQ